LLATDLSQHSRLRMMSLTVGLTNAKHLGMGAGVLSAGGGSFPYIEYLGTIELLQGHSPVELLPASQLSSEARVALVGMMGAPLPMFERFVDPAHFARPVAVLAQHLGVAFDAIMGYEIGSMNGLIPVMVAAVTGLPLVDADTFGRSFPEHDMSAFAIDGLDMAPIAVSDIRANDLVLTQAANSHWCEELLRPIATACGSIIAVCGAHTGLEVKQHAFHGTYSRAINIGEALLRAQAEHSDPIAALLTAERGARLAAGKVVDVDRRVIGGFVRGRAAIKVHGQSQPTIVTFNNEYSLVEVEGRRRAMVPDLIAVLDSDRGEPLGTEALRYGQHVTVVRFPPMARHVTPEGLAAVGPRAFGFDFDYEPPLNEVPT
jgi:uncharacterized protein